MKAITAKGLAIQFDSIENPTLTPAEELRQVVELINEALQTMSQQIGSAQISLLDSCSISVSDIDT